MMKVRFYNQTADSHNRSSSCLISDLFDQPAPRSMLISRALTSWICLESLDPLKYVVEHHRSRIIAFAPIAKFLTF